MDVDNEFALRKCWISGVTQSTPDHSTRVSYCTRNHGQLHKTADRERTPETIRRGKAAPILYKLNTSASNSLETSWPWRHALQPVAAGTPRDATGHIRTPPLRTRLNPQSLSSATLRQRRLLCNGPGVSLNVITHISCLTVC